MSENNPAYQRAARRIEDRKNKLLSRYQKDWQAMTSQWREDGPDCMWLTYSANYLFRSANVRWAVDPVHLSRRVPEAGSPSCGNFSKASFVVLTHNHGDHVDMALLAELAEMGHLLWVVPHHMLDVADQAGVKKTQIKQAKPGETILIDGIEIVPFTGLHLEYKSKWGQGEPTAQIESTGYFFKWKDKCLMLPGDTRTYDISALPSFGPVDTLLAHTWLGRGAALEKQLPLLEAFCNFIVALNPTKQVLLTHLWELGRGPTDYWDLGHTKKVRRQLKGDLPSDVKILAPEFLKAIAL